MSDAAAFFACDAASAGGAASCESMPAASGRFVMSLQAITRRNAMKTLGGLGIGTALTGCSRAASIIESAAGDVGLVDITDEDIFNFALNLESLETEYYLRGTTGRGMDDADGGSSPGAVTGGRMVPWKSDDLKEFMEEVAANELAHVQIGRAHV